MSYAFTTRSVVADDLPQIAALQRLAFGPGRFARTAYRVREGTPDISPFCLAVLHGKRLIAALRMTPVTIGGAGGVLLLGPLAVLPEFAGQGFGRRLVAEALEHARANGIALVVLVGDEPYYGRFGFKPVPAGSIVFPGPVDERRILAAELVEGALARVHGRLEGVR